MKRLIGWPWNKAKAEAAKDAAKPIKDPLEADTRLDIVKRGADQGWEYTEKPVPIFKSIDDFPTLKSLINTEDELTFKGKALDAATISRSVVDNGFKSMSSDGAFNNYTVPDQLQNWYMSQSFIGYQACSIIAQHWLVMKACSMVGKDAVRKGWEVKSSSDVELTAEEAERIKSRDEEMKIPENLTESVTFKNIFGIRVLLFVVESADPEYYEKPFNIDGVTKGSYKGMSQIDPYWCMPLASNNMTANPASMHFYEPEFWVISGKKYHRSHLIVLRNDFTSDILKPTYLFGGIPLTQQIYERVYAAERTANEAPLLAMSKRTTTLRTDVEKAIVNEANFAKRLMMWIKYRDNHGVKVVGKEEAVEQFDTNLSDFDSVIMNQYQLVAAIAKVPSTKLLGTSPKGFNATGEFEMVSYHEELETCQKHDLTPILRRHYLLLTKSEGISVKIKVIWEPVGSLTAKQQAEINQNKANTGKALIDGGVISPDEERQRLKDDRNSGYNRLGEEEAETQPGLSPENIALMGKSAGEMIQGKADIEQAKADILKQSGAFYKNTGELPEGGERGELAENQAGNNAIEPNPEYLGDTPQGATTKASAFETKSSNNEVEELVRELDRLHDYYIPEGKDVKEFDPYQKKRGTQPSVTPSTKASTFGMHHTVARMDAADMPKMKINGHICLIENPRTSIRKGNSLDGAWERTMPHHYGFIRGTKGADGDDVDCFIGPNPKSGKVFIINQNDNHSGEFDEHKVMLGFDSAEEAEKGYRASFDAKWQGFDSIHEVTLDEFNTWVKGDCNTPYGKV